MNNQTVNAIAQYLIGLMADGEYRSDWLTHMPSQVADQIETVGRVIVSIVELWF